MMYWRLSTFYLFHFASLGVLVPYWSLYLKHLGFNAVQIGELMALLAATKIVSPNIWGWIADHTGHRMAIVRIGALLALLSFSAVFVAHSYWPLAAVMILFGFFWNAVLPQFEANTLTFLGSEHHRYSSIRLWGSVGFIVTVVVLGELLERHGAAILPEVVLALLAGIWLGSLLAPRRDGMLPHTEQPSLRAVLAQPSVMALLEVSFLMQASHGPYYTFYTLYMERYGYARGVIGQLWALGVIAEIGIFLVAPRLIAHYGLRTLLLASLALTTVRWLLIGLFAGNLPLVLLAQTLHAASFGVYHAAAIAMFHKHFTGRYQGRGQAIYSSVGFGAGGAVGSYCGGVVWQLAGAQAAFVGAALLSAVALAVGWRWLRE